MWYSLINTINNANPKYSVWLTAFVGFFCSFLVYGLYGIHAIDDAWFLSFDYFYYYDGFEFDKVFEVGLGITAYFGKLHAYVYGFILDNIGWQRGYGQIISIVFIIVSAWLWYRIALLCGYEKHYAMAVGALILLLDPFMSVSHKARPESLIFILISLSIYSFYRKQFFIAALITGLAIENHPMGIAALCYLAAATFSKYGIINCFKQRKMLISICLGLGLGGLFYLFLHSEHLSSLLVHIKQTGGTNLPESSFLYSHFFTSRYHRHLPEFFIWSGLIIVFFTQKLYKTDTYRFAIFSFFFILLLSLLVSHGNKQYSIYIYPAFILIAISVVRHYKKLTVLLLFFCALMIPQYTFVYWKFKGFKFQEYIQIVYQAIPKNDLPIWGHPNHWFVFNKRINNKPERMFYSGAPRAFNKTKELIYIRDIKFEKYQPLAKELINLLQSKQSKLIAEATYQNHSIKIYHIKK